jgi:hypothetical protein
VAEADASRLEALGHDVRLISAQYVKPFLKGGKNDYRDAEAIAEAVQRGRRAGVAGVAPRLAFCRPGHINDGRDYSAARIHALQRSIALAQRSDVSTALSCRSSRIVLAFLAIESARVQIANHASARTISTLALLGCCKNSARPALRAMSITSSAVGVVPRDRKCMSALSRSCQFEVVVIDNIWQHSCLVFAA